MPNRHSVRSLLIFILLVAALVLVGCSDDDEAAITDGGSVDSSGDVNIVTDPSDLDVPWVLTLPSGNAISGVNDYSLNNPAAGKYTVSWPEIVGWNEPRPSIVEQTLSSGSYLTFPAIYLPQPGTVVVKSSPEGLGASWLMTSTVTPFEVAATGDSVLTNMVPGNYTVVWEDMDGFETPTPSDISVNPHVAMFLTGNYSFPDSMAIINPVILEGDAPWTFTGPAGDETSTISGIGMSTFEVTLNGSYTLTWGDVENFITPASQTMNIELEEDIQFDFTAEYLQLNGTVGISATLGATSLAWELTGPSGTVQPGSGNAELSEMRPGTYSLVAAAQDGWIPGAASTDDLASSEGISLTVTAEAGITVRSYPTDLTSPWTLTGPGSYSLDGSGEVLIGDLDAGSYTLTWDGVAGWTSPAASTQSLDANTGLLFEGLFEQGGNSLFVNTYPLSNEAAWDIIGPGGFNQSGTGMASLPLTETGAYTITWADVAGYMQPTSEVITFSGDESIEFKARYQELLDLVNINAGSFTQGSTGLEGCRTGFEEQHTVTITQDFIMKATEVTNAEFIAMAQWAVDKGHATANQYGVNDNLDGSTVELLDLDDGDQEIFYTNGLFTTNAPNHPVKEVSWFGAVAYCDWLSMYRGLERSYDHVSWQCGTTHPNTGQGFRLPTEAEWEYACRAGSSNAYANNTSIMEVGTNYCVSSGLPNLAWHDLNSEGWSHEVGLLDPNSWGLYDMHGNMMEWCNDWNEDTYYFFLNDQSIEEDPPGPLFGENRIARGGYFFSPVEDCRSAARYDAVPSNASYSIGFRVVMSDN